jgi:hypothetical protein
MKLEIAIIHLDMVIDTLELEEGEYSLGRSSENNIVAQHFSLHPKHGKIFFEEGQWFYEDFTTKRTVIINNREAISLSPQMSFATKLYVENGKAKVTDFSVIRSLHQAKLNKRLAIVSGFVALLLLITIIGYQKYKTPSGPIAENNLLNKVRDKIVEFETQPDEPAITQLIQYAGLKESDMKESSGFCTGFLVGPNIVLTAGHCLLGRLVIDINNDFYLKTSDGKKHFIKQVLGFDIKRDFLFLKMEGMESYGHLNFADSFRIQQKVYTVGNVHGEGIAIRDGIISSETSDQDDPSVKFIRYSAGTSPGNSGGPLINENGDIVALVFASTNTENFNLGTSSKDLKEAYLKFVEQADESQTIEVAMKRVLNFHAPLMLQALSLPYLPQFDEYPEIAQKFKEVSIEVQVPMDFDKVDQLIIEPLNKKIIETFTEVQSLLKAKKEVILDWKSFVTNKTPAILPSQFDESQSTFVKIENRFYPMTAGLIDSPSKSDYLKYREQLIKESRFDFQSYGYNIQISDKKYDLLATDVFYKPKDESGAKQRLINLSFGNPYSQLIVYGSDDVRTPGFFGFKLILKNFIADSGVLASAISRFVRPQSMKDFTIKEIEINIKDIETLEVKDELGRSWQRSHYKLFEATHILSYCTALPEATFCLMRVFNVFNNNMFATIENNFRRFILSHLLINPFFWQKNSLVHFVKEGFAKKIPLMSGLDLKQEKGKILGKTLAFPFEFEIDANKIESIRIQSGLYGNDEKATWTGYGLEWVQREEKKDQVCGLGLEVLNSQSNFILNFLRDRTKQEKLKKIKGEDAKPLPGVWYKSYNNLKEPFQIYGYCAPLEEDPRIADQYFVDFKNAKPMSYKHRILQE